jgi:Lung seven transmembrane receptor
MTTTTNLQHFLQRCGRHSNQSLRNMMTMKQLITISLLLFLLLVLQVPVAVEGGIQEVDMILEPTDEYVVYMVSYIQGPGGSIDLTNLEFEAFGDSYAYEWQQDHPERRARVRQRILPQSLSHTKQVHDHSQPAINVVWNNTINYLQQVLLQVPKIGQRKLQFPFITTAAPIENNGIIAPPIDGLSIAPTSAPVMGESDMITSAPVLDGITPVPSPVAGLNTITTAPTPTFGSNESSSMSPTKMNESDDNMADDNMANDHDSYDMDEDLLLKKESYIDMVIFPLPSTCKEDPEIPNSCDYSELGVGKRIGYGSESSLRWCCSEETLMFGICNKTSMGRLMVDHDKFDGFHIKLEIPESGPLLTTSLDDTNGYIPNLDSNNYMIMYANCDAIHGRDVQVQGMSVISSKHGLLPGGMYIYMVLFTIFTVVYAVLFAWYGICMLVFRKERIAIEGWIIFAVGLGLVEVLFRTADYRYWNENGIRNRGLIYLGILFGIFKEGISRCLLVMVSLGWGIVTDRLGNVIMTLIVSLGFSYIVVTGIIDVLILVAVEKYSRLSFTQENDIYKAVKILNHVQRIIDILFLIWIVIALFRTVSYLKREKQLRKLKRTQVLLKIVICSIFLALLFSLIQWIDKLQGLNEVEMMQHAWAKEAWMEGNYLFVLVSIAVLWKPNINARQYAYVMELGTNDYDHDDGVVTNDNVGTTDLELTENRNPKSHHAKDGTANERNGITNGNIDEDDDDDDRSIT